MPIHHAQVLTCLKLSKRRLALLINFNVPLIKDGIKERISLFCTFLGSCELCSWVGAHRCPPHPSPLPKERGTIWPRSINRTLSVCNHDGMRCSLSPRERAGVRGRKRSITPSCRKLRWARHQTDCFMISWCLGVLVV
ncbi:MAG TPA: GxxExxY protein [Verrucomicrobiae bacterium]|nr:GxxExxY protein [Verrucomicrobiae bacterium]